MSMCGSFVQASNRSRSTIVCKVGKIIQDFVKFKYLHKTLYSKYFIRRERLFTGKERQPEYSLAKIATAWSGIEPAKPW